MTETLGTETLGTERPVTAKFAFSFDRETFRGRFDTRQQALDAAVRALRDRADQPEGIFVGQWSVPDAQTAGHAEGAVAALRGRFRRATGEGDYLADASPAQVADLDRSLGATLDAWLARHGLTPQATRVHAVSHHPVPNVHHVLVPAGERETSLIGEA